MSKVSRITVGSHLKESIREAVNTIGGISEFISEGDKVLVKPNFNTADPFPASSDKEFITSVIELILEIDVESVTLGDSCTFSQSTRKVMNDLKIFELEKEYEKLKVISFDEQRWIVKNVPKAKYLKKVSVPEILNKVDKVVFLPCLKTHAFAQYTGALKLSVGLMRPRERLKKHMWKLQEKVAELNLVVNPDLVVMDARKCFINGGPSSGGVEDPNVILASESRVELDIEGIKIIQGYKGNSLEGLAPEEITQIRWAKNLGIK